MQGSRCSRLCNQLKVKIALRSPQPNMTFNVPITPNTSMPPMPPQYLQCTLIAQTCHQHLECITDASNMFLSPQLCPIAFNMSPSPYVNALTNTSNMFSSPQLCPHHPKCVSMPKICLQHLQHNTDISNASNPIQSPQLCTQCLQMHPPYLQCVSTTSDMSMVPRTHPHNTPKCTTKICGQYWYPLLNLQPDPYPQV